MNPKGGRALFVSADPHKNFLISPPSFFGIPLILPPAIGYNNDWLKRLVDNLPTAFDLFRPGTGVSCSNTMEEASNMKKLLTIMLAVLLAALAVAASAEDNVKNADIIIVGAGGGGLSAAIEAVNDGAQSVIVLEKTGKTGGSLNFTSGSMSGAETVIQKIDGIEDTKESFVQDILNNGAHLGTLRLRRHGRDGPDRLRPSGCARGDGDRTGDRLHPQDPGCGHHRGHVCQGRGQHGEPV